MPSEPLIRGDAKTLADWQEFAKRDDCLDQMVPSDLRQILGVIAERRPAPADAHSDDRDAVLKGLRAVAGRFSPPGVRIKAERAIAFIERQPAPPPDVVRDLIALDEWIDEWVSKMHRDISDEERGRIADDMCCDWCYTGWGASIAETVKAYARTPPPPPPGVVRDLYEALAVALDTVCALRDGTEPPRNLDDIATECSIALARLKGEVK